MSAEPVAGSFGDVFALALRGHPCSVVGLAHRPLPLPIGDWTRVADESDALLVDECLGATLDIGCGPGRLTARLSELGHHVLGIDIVREAVDQTHRRGASAIVRDVFQTLPGEGRWQTALLADGNIGIGGDPVALLHRARELLTPRGRIVAEVGPNGMGLQTVWATLECQCARSSPFRWSLVGLDAIHDVAREAGLIVSSVRQDSGRSCVVIEDRT